MTTPPNELTAIPNIPRRDLSFRLSRRDFFGLLQTELQVNEDEARGIPGFKLADLGAATDDLLAQIVPVIVPGCVITVDKGQVWGRVSPQKEPVGLFGLSAAATHTFNLFNGYHDIGTAATQLAAALDWPEEQAFAFTRDLFLELAQMRISVHR